MTSPIQTLTFHQSALQLHSGTTQAALAKQYSKTESPSVPFTEVVQGIHEGLNATKQAYQETGKPLTFHHDVTQVASALPLLFEQFVGAHEAAEPSFWVSMFDIYGFLADQRELERATAQVAYQDLRQAVEKAAENVKEDNDLTDPLTAAVAS